jgi:hypothetical protein
MLVAPGGEGIAAVQVVEVVHRHHARAAVPGRQVLVELVQRVPQRIGLRLHVAQPLPAVHGQVADVGAEQAEELVAQVEVEGDAVLLAPQRSCGGHALADLQ